jgi:hypothetical protein
MDGKREDLLIVGRLRDRLLNRADSTQGIQHWIQETGDRVLTVPSPRHRALSDRPADADCAPLQG